MRPVPVCATRSRCREGAHLALPRSKTLPEALARIFHKESAARRDKPASTSLRLLAVLTVLFKYASARQTSRALYPRASDASRGDSL